MTGEGEEASKPEETGTEAKDAETDSSKVLDAVKERLRFFFSDPNVRQDAFLRKYLLVKAGEDDNSKAKAVPVEALLRFNTIKQHTDSPEVVVQAAKELDSILTVHDNDGDGALIGRVDPFTESKIDENIPNTLYLSNLPVEKNRYKHTPEEIRQLFGDKASTIVLVKFRFGFQEHNDVNAPHKNDNEDDILGGSNSPPHKGKPRVPLGACLVEFENLPALEAAAAHTLTSKDDGETLQPTHVLKLGEHHVIEVQLLQDYLTTRRKERKKRKPAEMSAEGTSAPKVSGAGNDKDSKGEIDWKSGCVIQLTGIECECDRETILADVAKELDMTVEKLKSDKLVYIDYSRGQTHGALRFHEPIDAIAKLCDKLNSGDVTIAGKKVEKAVVLEGEDEKKYWTDFMEFKKLSLQRRERGKNNNNHHHQRKKGRRS